MKKTYIIPTMECVTIKADVVLADGSITLTSTGGTGTVNDNVDATGDALSRKSFSIWGDDEEE